MDYATLIYAILASLLCELFSRNRKYYQKTADSYGTEFADKIFRTIKICGRLMLIGGIFYLILILTVN